MTHVVQTVNT